MPETAQRWHRQTKRGGGHVPPEERGDCVPACITSILGLPLDAVANTHGDGWWDRLNAECEKHGYCLALLDVRFAPPDGYWIASLPSLNLPADPDGKEAWHSVVARGYNLEHDPALGERYTIDSFEAALAGGRIVEGWVLVPLDPARVGLHLRPARRRGSPPVEAVGHPLARSMLRDARSTVLRRGERVSLRGRPTDR